MLDFISDMPLWLKKLIVFGTQILLIITLFNFAPTTPLFNINSELIGSLTTRWFYGILLIITLLLTWTRSGGMFN